MNCLGQHAEGTILTVRAIPGARVAGIRGLQNDALVVAINVVAENGRANRALVELLAKQFGVRRSQLELLSGETSRRKRFLVRGAGCQQLADRIQSLLEEP